MIQLLYKSLFTFFCFGMLFSCSNKDENIDVTNESVLVTVNGTTITRTYLDYTLDKLLANNIGLNNSSVEKEILQSLISARAMAILAEANLDSSEIDYLNMQVTSYREELLVKLYIEMHADPQPVSSDMVKEFYQNNAEKFGGDKIKTFEFITLAGDVGDDEKKRIQVRLSNLPNNVDLKLLAKKLVDENIPVSYKNAEMRIGLIDQPLRDLVDGTSKGDVRMLNDKDSFYLVKVNNVREIPAKPLSEVSAEIRKYLAPIQLRNAVKRLSDEALLNEKITIEYIESN